MDTDKIVARIKMLPPKNQAAYATGFLRGLTDVHTIALRVAKDLSILGDASGADALLTFCRTIADDTEKMMDATIHLIPPKDTEA